MGERDLSGAASPRGRDRQTDATTPCRRSLKAGGPGARDRQIGAPYRVRLDIYLVLYRGERGEVEKSREKETEEGKGKSGEKGKTEAASSRGRQKKKGLRLEAEDQLAWANGGSGRGLSLKGTEQTITTAFLL